MSHWPMERCSFASELKAILAYPDFRPTVDTRALAMMLRQGWMPDQHCIWKGVFKLPPGTMLSVQAEDLETASVESLRGRVRRWWSLAAVAETGQRYPLTLDESELDTELDRLLRSAVRQRMVADVPLGAFLSGGIDSSTVVALMQAQSSRPIRTFTIGFSEAEYDEAAHASEVARYFGTDHTEFRLTPAEVCAVIPELPQIWDEPFADELQIPTLLLSRLARQHVTVALSGDGGDECFGGYARHFMLARLAALFRLPSSLRRLAASALLKLTPQAWLEIFRILQLPAALRPASNGTNLQKFARALEAADEQERYNQLTTFGSPSVVLDPGAADPADVPPLPDAVGRLIYRDMAGYLTGRHSGQARPRDNGGQSGGTMSVSRRSRRRVRVAPAHRSQDPRRPGQKAIAARAPPLPARSPLRTTEARLQCPYRRMADGPFARLGGRVA